MLLALFLDRRNARFILTPAVTTYLYHHSIHPQFGSLPSPRFPLSCCRHVSLPSKYSVFILEFDSLLSQHFSLSCPSPRFFYAAVFEGWLSLAPSFPLRLLLNLFSPACTRHYSLHVLFSLCEGCSLELRTVPFRALVSLKSVQCFSSLKENLLL